ncbi:uncharacterized protein IWZ02DRAFT_497239 [Phyllosticta citriasiana]|uniref:uncharacterized protein n=1 Tax=Phyllosticta citriasiana TaxID=595635 RepID=UPI0030FDC8A6
MSPSQVPRTSSEAAKHQITVQNGSEEMTQEAPYSTTHPCMTASFVPTWYDSSNAPYAPVYTSSAAAHAQAHASSSAYYVPASASSPPSHAPANTSSNAPDSSDDFDYGRLRELLEAELGYIHGASKTSERAAVEHSPAEQTATEKTPDPHSESPPSNTAISAPPAVSQHQSDRRAEPNFDLDNEKPYGCEFCSKRYTAIYSKRRHERLCHPDEILLHRSQPEASNPADERPFSCSHCDKRFKELRHKERHERAVHPDDAGQPAAEKPHACDFCGKRFRNLEHKRRHERENHTNPRSFECPICKKFFRRTDAFKIHMVMTHGVEHPEVQRQPELSESATDLGQRQQSQDDQGQQHGQNQQQGQQEQEENASRQQRDEEDEENPCKRRKTRR